MNASDPHQLEGLLLVDKPSGMTSHDVVARLRHRLKIRQIGHAGTLDPMATGVLVVLVGEATKLGPYLTADDKRYRARVAFGRATDTLDAEGRVTGVAEVPAWLLAEIAGGARAGKLAEALAAERSRREQVPPLYSAIQVEGVRSYDRARAGEAMELAPRPVAVRAIDVASGGDEIPATSVDLELAVSKGYYVRSLARDLGERLGVPAHLAALRRLASGPFTLDRSVALDAPTEALTAAIVPLAEAAAQALPRAVLTPEGASRARQGKRLASAHFVELPPDAPSSAWLTEDGRLVAIGAQAGARSATNDGVSEEFVVARGFVE
jgi:tRNA pseudouridine55 synthase